MSAPLTGPATFVPGTRPGASTIEFTGERTVELPMRVAIPTLLRARAAPDAHESVTRLAGLVLLGMRRVAAGDLEPADGHWRAAPLRPDEEEQVRRLAGPESSVAECAAILDAVADALPRTAPHESTLPGGGAGGDSDGFPAPYARGSPGRRTRTTPTSRTW